MKYFISNTGQPIKIGLLLFFTLLSFSCDKKNKGEWIVSDVSKDTVLTVSTKVKHPSTLILKIDGETDDSVSLHSILIAGGQISEEYQIDHYCPKISVQFKSYKAKKGHVRIRYFLP